MARVMRDTAARSIMEFLKTCPRTMMVDLVRPAPMVPGARVVRIRIELPDEAAAENVPVELRGLPSPKGEVRSAQAPAAPEEHKDHESKVGVGDGTYAGAREHAETQAPRRKRPTAPAKTPAPAKAPAFPPNPDNPDSK